MSNQIVITSGAKVRSLEGVLTGTSGVVSSVPLGAANGVATLDSGGKVPVSQLPSSVVTYLGTWNAATNTPTLTNGVGDAGDMYICNVAGTVNFGAGPVTFAVGDWVLYGSGTWQKSNGQNGTVTSVGATITGGAIGITGSPITTAGTLAFAFAGTNLQYVNGAGDLVTFPSLTGYIPYTGATTAIDLNAKSVVNISNLGINTTTVPTILLRAVGDNNSSSRIAMRGYSSNASSSSIRVTKFRGTVSAPQAPQSGDSLGKFELAGYGTTSSEGYPQASFEGLATENWGATARGSKVVIKITPNTTITQVIALTINQDKSAVFENSVTGTSLIKTGGTSSQFLKADGSVDSSAYITLASLSFTAGSGAYNSTTGVITIPTNNNQITNGANYITLGSISAGAGISYNSTTGVITSTITQYTDALARAAISGGTGISYNSTTGVITNTITQYTNALAIAAPLTGYVSGAGTISATDSILTAIQKLNGNIGALTTGVSSVFGRTGVVVATEGDYTLTQLGDVTITTPSSGQVLKYNGTAWVNNSDTDTGITTLNTLTALTQTFAVGTSGTDFTISSATSTHTFNLPTASATNRGALSSADWSTFNGKQAALSGTGFVKISGTTISYDNSTYYLASNPQAFISLLALSSSATGLTYTNTTGVFSFTAGYSIPTNASQTNWDTAYNNRISTLNGLTAATQYFSTGASGTDFNISSVSATHTFNFPSASATARGLLSSADWTTFNNKQSALTNPVTGTGTTNYLPKFTGTSTIGNSIISESGTIINITGTLNIRPAAGTSLIDLLSAGAGSKNYQLTSQIIGVSNTGFAIRNVTDSRNELIIDGSGNLGLGVTPSAWSNSGNLQLDTYVNISSQGAYGGTINNNAYYNSGWKYIGANYATQYQTIGGEHRFLTAGVGSGAGAAITFTQAMTLTAAGRLLLGTATEGSYQLDISANGYRAFRIQGNDDVIMTIGSTISSSQNWTFGATANGSGQGSNLFFIGTSTNNPSGTLTKNFQIASTGAATFSSTIKTGATSYGAGAIKLGIANAGAGAVNIGGYMAIEIDGTTYFLNLYTSTP